jgi:hypothetical protein
MSDSQYTVPTGSNWTFTAKKSKVTKEMIDRVFKQVEEKKTK